MEKGCDSRTIDHSLGPKDRHGGGGGVVAAKQSRYPHLLKYRLARPKHVASDYILKRRFSRPQPPSGQPDWPRSPLSTSGWGQVSRRRGKMTSGFNLKQQEFGLSRRVDVTLPKSLMLGLIMPQPRAHRIV